ncbi:ATP-grasp domain-containing protein [Enterobacter sichuanensis]
MKNKIVLILAKTEYNRTPYDVWLQGTGITPVLITSSKFYGGYVSHIKDCYCLDDYDNDDDSLYKLSEKIYQTKPFDYVFCRAEVDVIRAAEIRSRYQITGQVPESAVCYRDKYLMKEQLSGSKIRMARFHKADSEEDILSFLADNRFPVVIKPRLASGSAGVAVIKSRNELNIYLKNSFNPATGMLIEEYIDGEMYHVDGLVVGKELKFIQPFKYINDCLSYRENLYIGNIPVGIDSCLYSRLTETTRDIISRMPVTENFAFHCELWVTKQDNIVFCEIASRTGGGMISFLIEAMSGFNIDRAWLLAECHINTVQYPVYQDYFLRFGCVCIPPANGKLISLPMEYPPEVRRTHLTGKVGEIYDGGEKSGLYLIGHVVEADDPVSVRTLFSACYENIHHCRHWESISND